VLALIQKLASALTSAGLGPGHGIAMFTSVSPEAFAAQMAAHVLGCRVVGIRPGYTARQLAHVLGMQIDALVTDASTLTPELALAAAPARVFSLGPCAPGIDLLAMSDAALWSGGPALRRCGTGDDQRDGTHCDRGERKRGHEPSWLPNGIRLHAFATSAPPNPGWRPNHRRNSFQAVPLGAG
jgi:hypothetical protein